MRTAPACPAWFQGELSRAVGCTPAPCLLEEVGVPAVQVQTVWLGLGLAMPLIFPIRLVILSQAVLLVGAHPTLEAATLPSGLDKLL